MAARSMRLPRVTRPVCGRQRPSSDESCVRTYVTCAGASLYEQTKSAAARNNRGWVGRGGGGSRTTSCCLSSRFPASAAVRGDGPETRRLRCRRSARGVVIHQQSCPPASVVRAPADGDGGRGGWRTGGDGGLSTARRSTATRRVLGDGGPAPASRPERRSSPSPTGVGLLTGDQTGDGTGTPAWEACTKFYTSCVRPRTVSTCRAQRCAVAC